MIRARLLAYGPPAVVFATAIVLIITQALGAPATRSERITWLAVEAVIAAVLIYQISAARAWARLYRSVRDSFDSLQDSYDKCSASRDYWMRQVQTGAAALAGEEPPPSCTACGQKSRPVPGPCGHEVCSWCGHCPACAILYKYKPFMIT